MTASRKAGRPSVYSEAIAQEIYLRMADGESLRQICKDEHMPARSVVFEWVRNNPEFRELYETARHLQLEGYADEIIDIADDATGDWVKGVGPDGEPRVVFDHERIKRDRERVKSRKWMLARLFPRKYGRSSYLNPGSPETQFVPTIPSNKVKGNGAPTPKEDPLAKALAAFAKAGGLEG